MKKKSVISLISYDAEYLPGSISTYYNYVDEIILGLDSNRRTWSGNPFSFDESKLWSELDKLDGDKKIQIVEGDFYKSQNAIENDTYERNFLKSHVTHDWVFSFDADEYLLNPKPFFYDFCNIAEDYYDKVDICMTWATPFKVVDKQVLVIADDDGTPFYSENQGIATCKNNTYTWARWTNLSAGGAKRLQSPLVAVHWSLCREEEAVKQKINNNGHSDLAATDSFFNLWKNVNLSNYTSYRNFKTSGLGPQWPRLVAVPIEHMEAYYNQHIQKAYR